ncbi:unnamed protein product, partial [Polarella glacialis]
RRAIYQELAAGSLSGTRVVEFLRTELQAAQRRHGDARTQRQKLLESLNIANEHSKVLSPASPELSGGHRVESHMLELRIQVDQLNFVCSLTARCLGGWLSDLRDGEREASRIAQEISSARKESSAAEEHRSRLEAALSGIVAEIRNSEAEKKELTEKQALVSQRFKEALDAADKEAQQRAARLQRRTQGFRHLAQRCRHSARDTEVRAKDAITQLGRKRKLLEDLGTEAKALAAELETEAETLLRQAGAVPKAPLGLPPELQRALMEAVKDLMPADAHRRILQEQQEQLMAGVNDLELALAVTFPVILSIKGSRQRQQEPKQNKKQQGIDKQQPQQLRQQQQQQRRQQQSPQPQRKPLQQNQQQPLRHKQQPPYQHDELQHQQVQQHYGTWRHEKERSRSPETLEALPPERRRSGGGGGGGAEELAEQVAADVASHRDEAHLLATAEEALTSLRCETALIEVSAAALDTRCDCLQRSLGAALLKISLMKRRLKGERQATSEARVSLRVARDRLAAARGRVAQEATADHAVGLCGVRTENLKVEVPSRLSLAEQSQEESLTRQRTDAVHEWSLLWRDMEAQIRVEESSAAKLEQERFSDPKWCEHALHALKMLLRQGHRLPSVRQHLHQELKAFGAAVAATAAAALKQRQERLHLDSLVSEVVDSEMASFNLRCFQGALQGLHRAVDCAAAATEAGLKEVQELREAFPAAASNAARAILLCAKTAMPQNSAQELLRELLVADGDERVLAHLAFLRSQLTRRIEAPCSCRSLWQEGEAEAEAMGLPAAVAAAAEASSALPGCAESRSNAAEQSSEHQGELAASFDAAGADHEAAVDLATLCAAALLELKEIEAESDWLEEAEAEAEEELRVGELGHALIAGRLAQAQEEGDLAAELAARRTAGDQASGLPADAEAEALREVCAPLEDALLEGNHELDALRRRLHDELCQRDSELRESFQNSELSILRGYRQQEQALHEEVRVLRQIAISKLDATQAESLVAQERSTAQLQVLLEKSLSDLEDELCTQRRLQADYERHSAAALRLQHSESRVEERMAAIAEMRERDALEAREAERKCTLQHERTRARLLGQSSAMSSGSLSPGGSASAFTSWEALGHLSPDVSAEGSRVFPSAERSLPRQRWN